MYFLTDPSRKKILELPPSQVLFVSFVRLIKIVKFYFNMSLIMNF